MQLLPKNDSTSLSAFDAGKAQGTSKPGRRPATYDWAACSQQQQLLLVAGVIVLPGNTAACRRLATILLYRKHSGSTAVDCLLAARMIISQAPHC